MNDELVRRIVRETLRQSEDIRMVFEAPHSEAFAKDLQGRIVRIESSAPSTVCTKVSFADTGEEIPNVRRAEIYLDAQIGEMEVTLYRFAGNGAALEYATTKDVEISTMAVARGD